MARTVAEHASKHMSASTEVCTIHVQSPRDFAAWRTAARHYLAAQIPPHEIHWLVDDTGSDAVTSLFADEPTALPTMSKAARVSVPPKLLDMLKRAACYRAADRWALLYKVLWRWTQGEHSVTSPADADGARLHVMTKAVSREIHHMHAYVRFRECTLSAVGAGPQFVAWFEPAHNVLREAAGHFVDRMGKASWLIATPYATAAWDGAHLEFGPGAAKPAEIEDAGEALWLTYYRNTFNPSRVNVNVMRSHMPVRFWKNLPEAPLIPAMVTAADTGAKRIGQSLDVDTRVRAGEGAIVRMTAQQAQPQRPTAHSLDECRRCELWRNATHGVPGAGPGNAKIIIVGEQPGDQEDLAGKPFVGPAGQMLDKALIAAGIARDEIYLTNAVKHFKWELRGKRRVHKTPAQKEIEACHYWLQGEMSESQAKVIVTLGASALKAVLGVKAVALGKVGEVLEHDGRNIVPTYHPSYVLRLRDEGEKLQATKAIVNALKLAARLAA